MYNHSLNQKNSASKLSENSLKKYISCNPWLLFCDANKIEYQILSLRQNDTLLFNANSCVYIVLIGSLVITKVLNNARRITLNLLTVGDTFGHSEFVNHSFYYEAEAIDTTQVMCINYITIIEACNSCPSFNLFFVNHLLACSAQSYHFIEIISHKSISNRLVSLLLLLAEQSGSQSSNGIILHFTVTHKILAKIIGSNRVSVTRILLELMHTKLISVQKKKIIIHSPVLLSQRILNKS